MYVNDLNSSWRPGRQCLANTPVIFDSGVRSGDHILRALALGTTAVAFGGYTFVASVTMPAFVSGTFRVRFWVFVLGALVAGIGWIGMYVGLSYVYGEEVAKRIGDAGTKALLGVLVIVAIGLGIRAGVLKVARDPARKSA